MSTAGFESAAPLASGRAVGQVQSVNLDAQDCVVKIGPTVADGVTWYGDPPAVGDTVQMVQTANRLVIQSSLPATGGSGGSGTVQAVAGGIGITVAGTPEIPIVSANRLELDDWFADKDTTEGALAGLTQKVDALVGQLVYIGTYNAATKRIDSLSLMASSFPAYAIGKDFLQIPAAGWNAKHYFIVSVEGQVLPDADGISEPTGSVANWYRVGDWILSNGQGVVRIADPADPTHTRMIDVTIEPMIGAEPDSWLHMSYSSRQLLASSIVLDKTLDGINPALATTVMEGLQRLALDKLNRHGTDTFTGDLSVQSDNGLRLKNTAGAEQAVLKTYKSGGTTNDYAGVRVENGLGALAPIAVASPRGDNDAATRKYVEDADAAVMAKQIGAGAGLSGGGALSLSPTLNVGSGPHIQADLDSVRLAPHALQINDWNEAITDGFYMVAPGGGNPPGTSLGDAWSYGIVVSHNTSWVLQRAWMFASSYPSGLEFQRWCWNGAWQPWRRTNNYVESYGGLDGMVYHEHAGTRRFAAGLKSAEDEWRVQCYSGGAYTRSGIRVVQDGRVLMPYTMQSGADSITPVANQNTTKRINFDTPFTTTPQVQVTVISGVTGDTVKGWAATGVDTSGFTMNIHRINTTSTSFMWTATAD